MLLCSATTWLCFYTTAEERLLRRRIFVVWCPQWWILLSLWGEFMQWSQRDTRHGYQGGTSFADIKIKLLLALFSDKFTVKVDVGVILSWSWLNAIELPPCSQVGIPFEYPTCARCAGDCDTNRTTIECKPGPPCRGNIATGLWDQGVRCAKYVKGNHEW